MFKGGVLLIFGFVIGIVFFVIDLFNVKFLFGLNLFVVMLIEMFIIGLFLYGLGWGGGGFCKCLGRGEDGWVDF